MSWYAPIGKSAERTYYENGAFARQHLKETRVKTTLLRILLSLFALLHSAGVYASESTESTKFVQIEMEVGLGHDDDPGPPSLGQDLTWDLSEAKETWCERTVFRASSHPNSNPYQRFNEENGGLAFSCSTHRDSMLYTIIGGVHNSRDGDAVFGGKGLRLRTPMSWGPYVGVGAELNLVYYSYDDQKGIERVLSHAPQALIAKLSRIPKGERGYIIFPLPVLVYQVGYAWENEHMTGHVSFVGRNLAGAAHLRGIVIAVSFRKNIF